jgi:VWFA-related protein
VRFVIEIFVMKHQPSKFIFVFLTFVCALSITVFAQTTPTPTPKVEEEVLKIESRLVTVPVSVTDANGQPVTGLKAADFRVAEESKNQEIAQVSDAEKVPLEIAILFDISASTDSMFQFEQETAAQFLKEVMRPEDRATIITVGERANLVQGRDTAENAAISIKSIQPTKQFTAFYDSVSAAAAYLQKNAPQGTRKVIIVISDGEDTNSEGIVKAIWDAESRIVEGNLSNEELRTIRVKARDNAKLKEQSKVLQSLQNADTVFYAINPAGNSYQLNKMSLFGQSNLQKFADETGGTSFLPKLQPIDLKDTFQNSTNTKKNQEILTRIFRQLTNELQAQYLVQYYSEGDFPNNKYVKLDVGLTNPGNARIRARQGYFVKN